LKLNTVKISEDIDLRCRLISCNNKDSVKLSSSSKQQQQQQQRIIAVQASV
jgi:hypothetical protein